MVDVDRIRAEFPALSVRDDGVERIFFDNPGGTQICRRAAKRMSNYLVSMNANAGGAFVTSRHSDELLDEAHRAMADFFGTHDPGEIIFGQNMTSLTFHISRSIGRLLSAGDEILLTRMDHDANVSPWLMLAEDHNLTVRWLDFDPRTYRYRMDQLPELITNRTKLVAINYASNAIGTVNDVTTITQAARSVGALSYVDAVQFAPHFAMDAETLGCDFLVCSSYKFYGPHQGILWGRRAVLETLPPYKVRPASGELPVRFETGTLSHEGLAGVLGTVKHWAWIGKTMTTTDPGASRRKLVESAFTTVADYEKTLTQRLINGLLDIPGVTIHGLTDEKDLGDRVPTVGVVAEGHHPRELAVELADQNIFTWDGHYYAIEVIERLGLADSGGMLRIGLGQYNTTSEVDKCLDVLSRALQ